MQQHASYNITPHYEYVTYSAPRSDYAPSKFIACNWPMLRGQLLVQWRKLTASDLDDAGPDRVRLARLIEHKYGVSAVLAENYLRNFERTMPLTGHA